MYANYSGQTQIDPYDSMAQAMYRADINRNRTAQPMQGSPMNNIASAMMKKQLAGGGSMGGTGNTLNYNPAGWGESAFGGSGAGGAPVSTGSGGAQAGGSGFASAGPWALLAATIIANENEARRGGYRDKDHTQYAKDVLGGKVVEQDINKRWAPKLGSDKFGLGGDMRVAGELSSLDPSNAWKTAKNDSSVGKFLRKLF